MKYSYLIALTTLACSPIFGETLPGVYISGLINRTGKKVRLYKRTHPRGSNTPPIEVTVGSPISIPTVEELNEQLLVEVAEKWFSLYIKSKYDTEKVILRPIRTERMVREKTCSSILPRAYGESIKGTLYLYAGLLEIPLPVTEEVAYFSPTSTPLN